MFRQISTIAWITCREVLHSRLLLIFIGGVLVTVGIVTFLGDVVVTDTESLRAGAFAWVARWLAMLTLTLFCAGSVSRDGSDKVIELLVALPVRRETVYLGKLAGMFVLAFLLAGISLLASVVYAPPMAAVQWAVSLWLELCVVVSFTLWVATSIGGVVGSVIFSVGFYVLARAMQGMVMMAKGPFFDPDSAFDHILAGIVDAVSWILPPLYAFASADWLINTEASIALGRQLGNAGLYIVLLVALALIEQNRKQY